ncbi:ABC transporter permease [Hydrogenothermus marinus]|uniref:Lipoprotein-releasing system permease protein n=1 Tax=Hydrogenothermus marinus TaxID=133270 RepID=A0A3M0BGB8_9AQUI|nr:ABC transporter permease [Hydrogenothermus marinus]RMA96181.1 lipoprotein-releasing system permease protein [Hydrogenothermus marinus]
MPLYIKIALRYLFSLKSKALSFMSIISLIGIVVGVSALLVTLAVMNGFQYGLKKKILETTPQVIIMKLANSFWEEDYEKLQNKLKKIEDIKNFQPFIYSQALASVGSTVQSIFVRGVYPDKDKKIMKTNTKIIKGSYDSIKNPKTVLIGKDLALILGVDVGDKITLISPYGRKTAIGYIPKVMKVKIGGIVNFGLYEYDSSYVQMNIKDAQKFLDYQDRITGIQLNLKDPYKADIVKKKLEEILDPIYIVKTWIDMNKTLFQALQLEELAMFLVIALIVLVASFNISSLLITKSREKRKDIAILKTIGANNRFILKIFLWQGMIIGIVGTIIGLIIGLTIIYIGDTYHLVKLNPEVYMMEYLPLKINIFHILAVSISSLVICFISSIIPSYFASKEIPAKILRYE